MTVPTYKPGTWPEATLKAPPTYSDWAPAASSVPVDALPGAGLPPSVAVGETGVTRGTDGCE